MTVSYVAPLATEQLLIQIGDGASPEVFTAPCTINSARKLSMSADAKATVLPRCDDPTKPGKTVRRVVSTDSQITGSGIMNAVDFKAYADWMLSGAAKNVKVNNALTGGLILTGSYVITQLDETGSGQGEEVTADITLMQADLPVTTTAS